ncbi:MAG: cell division protein FtsQ/DivIB [Thermodesulfobacteriota bacterium]
MTKRNRKNRYQNPNTEASQNRRRPIALIAQAMTGGAVIIGMSLLFVFSHDWVTQCDYFRAEKVTVEGTDRLDPVAIQKVAHIWEGVNILSVNLTSVRKRLISEPWIADADIRRDLPSAITIRIDEHQPLAIIDLGRMFLINTEGAIFKETEKERFPALPVIKGVNYPEWKGRDQQHAKAFSSVMAVLRLGSRPGSPLPNQEIEKIIVDEQMGLTLTTEDRLAVITLGYGDYKKKYRRFEKICAHMKPSADDRQFYEMDLKNPDRVVARPAEAASQTVAGKGGLT